jgi:pseudaminic acid synthase
MIKPIFINGRELSNDQRPFIIAEISANHNGSIDRALETILAAKQAGVDAIKIQTYTPDTMTIESNNEDFFIKQGMWKGRSLYDLYSEAFTPFEWHERLFQYAKDLNITLFSTPFDEKAVDLLSSFNVPAFKVASFEIVDIPLIKYIAKRGKPMLISTGMSSLEEVEKAIQAAQTNGCQQIGVFHCISSYPTPIEEANLKMITILREKFNVQVGLSDHTKGATASIVATGLGATFIEKHFTLSRADGGVDSAFSLEPSEMKKLVQDCNEAFLSVGKGSFKRPSIEANNKIFRRSLYFVENLKKGEIVKERHIRRIRPGFGLPPEYLSSVIGKKVTRDVFRGDRVDQGNIEITVKT